MKVKSQVLSLSFDCVKYFMNTDAFHKFSTKYRLDSEIVVSFCESFAYPGGTKGKPRWNLKTTTVERILISKAAH